MNAEIVHIVNENFALRTNEDDLLEKLAFTINRLIVEDFDRLISILYRADVSEKKLGNILELNKNQDAGKLIAALYIERQLAKIKTRRENQRGGNENISEEERW